MRQIISLLAVFVLCGMLASTNAAAADAPIDAQGAASLKKLIEENLQWRLDAAKITGQGLAAEGAVEVSPKGKIYEVRMPRLTAIFGPQGKLDIGTIVINATPGQEGEWLADVTLPASMSFIDKDNVPTATIGIGKQHFTGSWWPAKEMFSKIDSLYQDVTLQNTAKKDEEPFILAINALKITLAMKDNKDGTWSGTNNFETSDIRLVGKGVEPFQVNIKKIFSNNTYDRLDVSQSLEARKRLQEIYSHGKKPTADEEKELIGTLFSQSAGLMDGMNSAFEINGFSAYETSTVPPQPRKEVSFDKLTFLGGTMGIRQEKTSARFRTGLSGFKLSAAPADYAGLVPHDFSTDISFDNLPIRKAMEALLSAAQSNGSVTPEAQTTTAGALIPKMLQDAGAAITIQDTFVKSVDLDSSLSGKIEMSPTAVMGANGKMTLSVRGMSETIDKLRTLATKPGADVQLVGYISVLSAVQLMGQGGVAPDGKALRNYNFELTPDGKLLLNGVDFKTVADGLSAGMMGGAPGTAPPVPAQSLPKDTPATKPAPPL